MPRRGLPRGCRLRVNTHNSGVCTTTPLILSLHALVDDDGDRDDDETMEAIIKKKKRKGGVFPRWDVISLILPCKIWGKAKMVEKVFDRAQRGTHSVDGCVTKLSRLCGITSTSTAVWAAAEECFLKALAPLAAAASQQHQRRKSSSLLPSPASVGLSRGRRAVVAVFAGFALAAGRGAHAAKFVAGLCGCAQPIVREWCCFALSRLCPPSLAEAAEQEEGAESGLLFVEDALMLRARDKATSVRVQCVLAAAVWQRRSVLLEDMLGTLAATDSSQEVRIAALRALRCGSGTPALLRVVERTRDVSEAVRKEAFVKLRHELPSISGVPNDAGQREALLHDGLNDRCDAVRGACSDLLLSWLAGEQNCPISLLSHLDFAESEELAVQVSKEIIQRALDTVLAVLSTKPPLQKGVLPSDEGALFARCLAECGHAPPQSLLLIGPHSGVTLQEIIASARDAQRDFVLQQLLHMAISSASSITAASLRAELSFFCSLYFPLSLLSSKLCCCFFPLCSAFARKVRAVREIFGPCDCVFVEALRFQHA